MSPLGEMKSSDLSSSVDAIGLIEKLITTKPIWFLPNVTREESSRHLNNKKPGNYIVRGSRQPEIMVLSMKTELEDVQHFLIHQSEGKVYLEDSDYRFGNIVSLVFHYSNICEELPDKLKLPEVLLTTTSLQNLQSLALLEQSFWTYPMAKSDRCSIPVTDVEEEIGSLHQPLHGASDEGSNSADNDCDRLSMDYTEGILPQIHSNRIPKITHPPPKHPRKTSLGSNTPSPPSKSRRRRSSDCVSFITSPARISPISQPIKQDTLDIDGWVTSPVFSGSGPRSRKLSVFEDSLERVQEEQEEKEDIEKANQKNECIYEEAADADSDLNSDYAVPVDAYQDQSVIYDELITDCDDHNDRALNLDHLKCDGSNQDYNSEHGISYIPSASKLKCDKGRKLSLGVILRKISTGSMSSLPQRKHSLPERRLSSMLTKVITLPKFVKSFSGESYQVNCDSWEFLNKEEKDVCWDEIMTHTNVVKEGESLESVYESESNSSNRSSLRSCQNITL